MKNKKSAFLFALYILGLCSCSNTPKGEIVLDDQFLDSYELSDKEIFFPTAHLDDNGDITSYDALYTIKNLETKETISSKYSSFKLSVGEYTITYKIGKKSLVKNFSIIDTTAPTIGFSGVPTDLFIQDIKDKKRANLPSVSIFDFSGYDEEKLVKTLTCNGENVQINDILETYSVNTYGEYIYTVSAEDFFGNKATSSATWTIKDKEYNPSVIKTGLLADFDNDGYTNLIGTSKVDQTFSIDFLSDKYLEEKSDEYGSTKDGVFKLEGSFNNVDNVGKSASFQFKLPTQSQFTYDDLEGKYLAFDVMLESKENVDIQPSVAVIGNIAQSDGFYMRSLYLKKNVTFNKWSTIYIDSYNAARLGLFPESTHDNGAGSTFPGQDTTYYNTIDGTVSSISLGISDLSNGNTHNNFTFYIDSIYIAENVLKSPVVRENNGALSWDAVNNAESYVVDLNGVKSTTDSTLIELGEGSGYAKIQAISNDPNYINSEETVVIYGQPSTNFSLNNPMYLELWRNSLSFNSSDDFENANYIYKRNSLSIGNDGLVANLGASNWGIVNGFSINLPKIAEPGMFDYISIKTKINKDSLKTLNIYSENYYKGNPLSTVSLAGKANTEIEIKIDLSMVKSNLSYLDFVFGIGDNTSSMEVVIESINFVKIKRLATPSVEISNKTLSWSSVDNASGYRVDTYSNGVKNSITITDCSYTVGSGEDVVLITAVDSSEEYVDSESLFFVQDAGAIHPATKVNTEKKSYRWSNNSLIQLDNISLPGLVANIEFSAGQMNINKMKVSKNDASAFGTVSELHYHNNITPKILQFHFYGVKTNDIVTIHNYEKSSFFSATDPNIGKQFYYVFDEDIRVTYNGNCFVLA